MKATTFTKNQERNKWHIQHLSKREFKTTKKGKQTNFDCIARGSLNHAFKSKRNTHDPSPD